MKYDAFISYSHSDCGTIAPAIQKAIENIGKPWCQIKRSLNIFRDETNLGANPHLWENIENALEESKNFILLASPKAGKSDWVTKEIEKWAEKDSSFQKFTIVITSGTIEWDKSNNDFDWKRTTCLPKCLKDKFQSEPLYIDLKNYINKNNRPIDYKSLGFTYKIVKIISAITGIEPREIESDEKKRNQIIRSILFVITGIFLVLSIFSISMWKNASKQEMIAKTENENAQKSEKIAIDNLKKFKIEEFEKNLRNGKIYLEADEVNYAKQLFLKADSTAKDKKFNDAIEIRDKKYLDSIFNVIRQK